MVGLSSQVRDAKNERNDGERTQHLSGINVDLVGDDPTESAYKEAEDVEVPVEEGVGPDKEDSCIYARKLPGFRTCVTKLAHIPSRLDST